LDFFFFGTWGFLRGPGGETFFFFSPKPPLFLLEGRGEIRGGEKTQFQGGKGKKNSQNIYPRKGGIFHFIFLGFGAFWGPKKKKKKVPGWGGGGTLWIFFPGKRVFFLFGNKGGARFGVPPPLFSFGVFIAFLCLLD